MEVIQTDALRKRTEQLAARREKDLKAREAIVAATSVQFDQTKTKMASAESDLLKAQTEGDALQAKLRASDTEIANLRKRIVEAESKLATDAASANPSAAELQAQLEEARKQIDAAEREKALLADKIKSAGERPAQARETEKKRRSGAGNPGIRGTVLAVNQAYNFVVLDLGGRQGVEANSEMLVLRGGTLIGKIRISSVEPATAIGDIITSSLARGVQVQPGDIVVYAGTNF
jgi:cell shape-determining protein MreC